MREVRASLEPNGQLPRTPAVGEVVAHKFRLAALLSADTAGTVFAAHHVVLGHVVALRFLHPKLVGDPLATRRFVQGARTAAVLKNEHVARIVDVGVHLAGMPYVVMEHPAGTGLDAVVRARVRMPAAEAIDYVAQACAAIREAHAAGIVHGAITPASLVFGPRPSGGRMVKVLGFELAALRGPQSAATDIAALAAVFDRPVRRDRSEAGGPCASVEELLQRLRTGLLPPAHRAMAPRSPPTWVVVGGCLAAMLSVLTSIACSVYAREPKAPDEQPSVSAWSRAAVQGSPRKTPSTPGTSPRALP